MLRYRKKITFLRLASLEAEGSNLVGWMDLIKVGTSFKAYLVEKHKTLLRVSYEYLEENWTFLLWNRNRWYDGVFTCNGARDYRSIDDR